MKDFSSYLISILEPFRKEIRDTSFQSIPYVLAGIASATVCSLYTYVFKFADSLSVQLLNGHLGYIFISAPVCFLGAYLLVHMFAPGAIGSGIPQVLAGLHENMDHPSRLSKLLSIRVIVVKILSSSFMALGGGAVGREGPSIQISASVFYLVRQYWTELGNKIVLKNMLIAGGASGLAAAFNTPLGGIIYAVEELAKDHVSNFRIGLLEAVIAAGLVAQLLNGPYLFLGFPQIPVMHRNTILAVLLVSIACGLAGALVGRVLFFGLRLRAKFNFKQSLAFVFCLSMAFAVLVYFTGITSVGSGKAIISDILFRGQESSALVSFGRVLGPLLASLTGAAGGIFAPSLASGAALGEWLGASLAPSIGNLAPICGMVAFLTGITRTPVTSFVLILEMTDRHSAIFPMMLTALIAHVFARIVDQKSFYENMATQIVANESHQSRSP